MNGAEPSLATSFSAIEAEKERFLAAADQLGPDLIVRSELRNGWTPAQLIQHLRIVEQIQIDSIPPVDDRIGPFEPRRPIVIRAITFMMRRRLRVPVPNGMTPEANVDYEDERIRWDIVRERMATALDGVGPDDFLCRHPIAGWMTARETLDLLAAHLHYHGKDL